MDASDEPGAAAAEAARRAVERVNDLYRRHADLADRRHLSDAGTAEQGTDSTLETAQQRQRVARTRLEVGLRRAALAHDRAADRHDNAAHGGGDAAHEHRRKAEQHRSAAVADRQRADDLR